MLYARPALVVLALAIASPLHAQPLAAPGLSANEHRLLQDARAAEARGDDSAAFEAYRTFAQSNRDAVDVALRFAEIARARLGQSQARALLRDTAGTNPAMRLAAATLTELSERRRVLEAFVTTHPDSGPALYLLSLEYAREAVVDQPLRDRLRERDLLGWFLGLEANGKLGESFVDSALLVRWLDRAERRLAALDASLTDSTAVPSATFMRSSRDWMVHLNMPEEVAEITYRLGKDGPYRSTGYLGAVDQRSGRKLVLTQIMLPLDTPVLTIDVKYRDMSGREAGPFPIKFDPRAIVLQQARETLDAPRSDWVTFTTHSTWEWAYFNTPMYTRCAIAKLEYGFNKDDPDTHFPLPPCDLRDPSGTPADAQSAVKMTDDIRMVSVRITFIDGKVETRRFRRPARR